MTKAVVGALKATPSADNTDDWLNPTEVVADVYTILLIIYLHELNLLPPGLCMAACAAASGLISEHQQASSPLSTDSFHR